MDNTKNSDRQRENTINAQEANFNRLELYGPLPATQPGAPVSENIGRAATGGGGGDGLAGSIDRPRQDQANRPPYIQRESSYTRPENPTVAVLDPFGDRALLTLNGAHGLGHGEVSARLAFENGYNVLRLQTNDNRNEFNRWDLSKPLKQLITDIDSGKLNLGKGDVLNLSLGQHPDPNFKTVSDMLGMNINGQNLAENKNRIIEKMRELAADPKADADVRNRCSIAVDTIDAINKIKERGIEVVHAAGNDNANGTGEHVSLEFLTVNHELSALRPTGEVAQYSANHNMTTPVLGQVDARYVPFNPLDPTPAAQQQGRYFIDGSNVSLPASEFGGLNLAGTYFNEGTNDSNHTERRTSPSFPPGPLTSIDGTPGGFHPYLPALQITNSDPKNTLPVPREIEPSTLAFPPGADNSRGYIAASTYGTSFANVFFLPTQFDRLKQLKGTR
ncbi:MAG: hypothetical protein K2X81_06650 [Candidatus Obscuribacterales bacterium]|nr:hypothetical protein [Candidatus Obscuribacterales bacterium]